MTLGSNAQQHLRSFVERIERLEEEKKHIAEDVREVYTEAKSNGFDVKAMRAVIRLRKQSSDERAEQEAILETYLHALGMLPLEEAIQRAADTPAPYSPPDTSNPPFAPPDDDTPVMADTAPLDEDIPGFLDRRGEKATA